MSNPETQHISIPKDVATKDDLDFFYLRKKGIEYIAELGKELWTDFNSHDPGITILEMLSYAISDLGMRISLPIEDLLASQDPAKGISEQFYAPDEIFPSAPVNESDYRKLFIDIPGIKNCWLFRNEERKMYLDCKRDRITDNPKEIVSFNADLVKEFTLLGLYDIKAEYDEDFINEGTEGLKKKEREALIAQRKSDLNEAIRKAYHANRNLCEDLVSITEVNKYPVAVCASIEVDNDADEELVHAQVLLAIKDYFSPSVRFYSIKEMMDKGYTSDQIFEGPVLNRGFIDTSELQNANLRKEIRLSDIIKIIMNIDGVKHIKEISIGDCDSNVAESNEWLLCVPDGQKPILCDKSTLNYNKGFLPLSINEKKVQEYLNQLKPSEDLILDKSISFPTGQYYENEAYTTIQNDFPDTYGIGINGLPSRASNGRKAQAKQLKGYLLFFDKILASYFKHLASVKEILSIKGNTTATYFTQVVQDIAGFEDLVKNYPLDDDLLTDTLFKEIDNNVSRRNEILDHLLARFAERFGEYTFLMKTLYGSSTNEVVLRHKEEFLADYQTISSTRGSGFNYYKQLKGPKEGKIPVNLWDTQNVSGTQKRLARLLGIRDYSRRFISNSFVDLKTIEDGGENYYSWSISNKKGKEILKATENYTSKTKAVNEMHLSVLLLIEASKYELEIALSKPITSNKEISTVRINKSKNKKRFSFSVINPEASRRSTERVTAKHPFFYNSQEKLKEKLFEIIEFFEEDFTEEGLFLVEHILLRPEIKEGDKYADPQSFIPVCSESCESCEPVDPYSYRVSIVLPGYTYRFADIDFRNYMENVIKQELPAHVVARICWVGDRQGAFKEEIFEDEKTIRPLTEEKIIGKRELARKLKTIDTLKKEEEDNGLFQFECAYKEFLEAKTYAEGREEEVYINPQNGEETTKLREFITRLFSLQTLYAAGRLVDCENDDDADGKVILGKTSLGSL